MKTYKGIDIALYQGNPDFAAVTAAVELLRQKSGEDADKNGEGTEDEDL